MSAFSPLSGLRVVEFTHFIAGPSAGQRLADLGAEVVKVEPPGGDPARPGAGNNRAVLFYALNRGKRSVVLDLKDPADEAAAQRLAHGADVVLHNISASSIARHGLDHASVSAVNPSVVYGSVTGFPSNTARGTAKAFDGIGQAESGMLWVNGTEESGPLKLPYAPVDTTTGNALAEAVLAALVRRLRTGEGAEIRISLFEAGVQLQQSSWSKFLQTGVDPGRIGNLEPDVAPAAEILRVADGWVILSAYLAGHFAALLDLLGLSHLADDPRFATLDARVTHQVALHDAIQDALTSTGWTVAEASERFESIRIAHGVVGSYRDIWEGDLLRPSGMIATGEREDGSEYPVLNPPYRVAGHERPTRSPAAPALGADTAAVREELAAGAWDRPAATAELSPQLEPPYHSTERNRA